LFLERKKTILSIVFLGARPQTPRVGFAECWANEPFFEAEQRFLLRSLEKEETTKSIVDLKTGLQFPG
jgi:hypothetical protein